MAGDMGHMGISLLNQLKLVIINKDPDSNFSWKWEDLVSWSLSWPELSDSHAPALPCCYLGFLVWEPQCDASFGLYLEETPTIPYEGGENGLQIGGRPGPCQEEEPRILLWGGHTSLLTPDT